MTRLAFVVIAAMLGGCCAAAESPIEGHWDVTRTLHAPPEGCPQLRLSVLDLRLAPHREHPIGVEGPELFDGNDLLSITDDAVTFSTSEYAYESSSGTVIIAHELTFDGERLVGTAWASGDGPTLGCRWSMDVVATRAGAAQGGSLRSIR